MRNKTKILFFAVFTILLNFIFVMKVHAANATISVTNSASTIVVGQSITTTVTVSSSSNIGAWTFDLKYDTDKLKLTSSSFGGTYIADVYKTANQKSAKYTFTFQSKTNGTANIYIANSEVVGYDEVKMTTSNGSRSVNIITQQQLEASYSKNNYLRSLEIDGVTLSPTFDKNVLEYSATFEPNTTKINIKANVEDSKSTITGAGEKIVTDGLNKIEVIVTAQNGNTRTYILNVTVKEFDPINVEVDGNAYSVVRKKDLIKCPSNFTEKEIKIKEQLVPGCYNEASKFNLVALKKEDTISLYIYQNNKYKEYKEVSSNNILLYPMSLIDIPSGYKKAEIKIGEQKIEGYQNIDDEEYSLIHGMNIKTGKVGTYLYDSRENTLQRYFEKEVEVKDKTIKQYLIIILVLGGLLTSLVIFNIILIIKSLIKKKKTN